MDRRTVGWIVAAVIIFIIIITVLVLAYFSKRPERASLYTDSDIMIMTPQRHWHHPEFDLEIRTICGRLDEGQYFIARMHRRHHTVTLSEYFMDGVTQSLLERTNVVELAEDLPNNSADFASPIFAMDYRFNEDSFLDDWAFAGKTWKIQLTPTRFPCLMGAKGFLSFDQYYTIASYAFMDTASVMTPNAAEPQLRLLHDWGQIDADKYEHRRYHIFLNDGSGAEIHMVRRDDGIEYTNICVEKTIGQRVNFPVEISAGTKRQFASIIFTSHKIPNFRLTLTPEYEDSASGVACYAADLLYGDSEVSGWCVFERYMC